VRIAIIGGTFDPIHNGHLAAAHSVASTFQVDEVHFIPAFSPPHKLSTGMTSSFHRFAMVALATMPFAQFRPSTIEVDALETRYTVQTLESMKKAYPAAQILLIVGSDMYRDIQTWRDFRRLFELAHIVVVNRPGFAVRDDLAAVQTVESGMPVDLPQQNSVFFLPFVEQRISSTEIRAAVHNARQWLPQEVWSYIEKNNLYS
jgi:nicotinate-nucleotide adenylyltransferase